MNKYVTLVAISLLLLTPISALPQHDENQDNEDRYDSAYDRDKDEVYETSFGNRYEYDLNNPSDRVMYEVDPAAQLRDSIDVDPLREIEQDLGEYGGGVLPDDDQ
ncbi:hypothetical protein ACFL00_00300 [Pseudomonadota bacterium]